jgi:hypothetical protein
VFFEIPPSAINLSANENICLSVKNQIQFAELKLVEQKIM